MAQGGAPARCRLRGRSLRGKPGAQGASEAAGAPALRSDASKCDSAAVDRARSDLAWAEDVTRALRDAVRHGATTGDFDGQFPKYVWGWFRGKLHAARHIGTPAGAYEAWPLEERVEWPDDPDGLLPPAPPRGA